MRVLLVFTGGGLGAVARYLVGLWAIDRFGAGFPWGTLTVNVTGGFLIGLIASLADEARLLSSDLRVFLVIGILGGFTTFSSFSLESWRLADEHQVGRAAIYVVMSVALAIGAATLGILTGRAVAR